jgi:hypothetical protein
MPAGRPGGKGGGTILPPGGGLAASARPAGSAGAAATVWAKGWATGCANDWANDWAKGWATGWTTGCAKGGVKGARGAASPLCVSDASSTPAKAAVACAAVSAAGSAAIKAGPARGAGGSSGIWGSIGSTGGFSKRGVAAALQLACHRRAKLRRALVLRLRQRAGGSDFKLGKTARAHLCGGELAGLPIRLPQRIAARGGGIACNPRDSGGKAGAAGEIIAGGRPGTRADRRQQVCAALCQRAAAAFLINRIGKRAHRLAPRHPCDHRLQAHQREAALFPNHPAAPTGPATRPDCPQGFPPRRAAG